MTPSKLSAQPVAVSTIPPRSGVHTLPPLSEPPMGKTPTFGFFPGGVAMSYQGVLRNPKVPLTHAPQDSLEQRFRRIYTDYETPGYVIGYRNGAFSKVSFSCVRTGEYVAEKPTEDEIARFRMDLVEKAKTDASVSLFLSQNPEVFSSRMF